MAPPSPRDPHESVLADATPAMRQYLDVKRQYRDAIVFFRMGDFYEMFYEDAIVAARALDLTLTSRAKDAGGAAIPMCGVPHHAVDGYLARMVRKGFRVAICEQVEDPRKAKGLVRREVVRVVSPGTLTDASYLDAREPAFIVALAPVTAVTSSRGGAPPAAVDEGRPAGVTTVGAALLDLSTGEFSAAEYSGADAVAALADEVAVLRPRELLVPEGVDLAGDLPLVAASGIPTTRVDGWTFDLQSAQATLLDQLGTTSLAGFGLEPFPAAVRAAGALVRYLRDTQKADLAHVRAVVLRQAADALLVDAPTLGHLEVVEGAGGGRAGSLLDELDRTVTAMGGRLLRNWLLRPLITLERIRDRLDAVEEFAFRVTDRGKARDTMKAIQDVERIVARAALGVAGPRDLVALKLSLGAVPRLRMLLEPFQAPLAASLAGQLDDLEDLRSEVERTLVDAPPALAREGGAIRNRVDAELDELRHVSRSGKEIIARME